MRDEETAGREAPDVEIAGSAFEAQAFEVTPVMPYGSRVIRARASEHVWDEAKAAGINLPAICHQGRCLTCAGELVEPGEFDPSDAVSYYPQDREAGYILLCTALVRSNLRIHACADGNARAPQRNWPARALRIDGNHRDAERKLDRRGRLQVPGRLDRRWNGRKFRR
ncbi:MAG: hypothetical protein DMG32_18020 [Acidobacteria bacterium]|nr:MAG: hypothetical protein DMG32_18020 [Acidobacteriota bacterium]